MGDAGKAPNGPMRPDGERGYPGLSIEPGERIAIVASLTKPRRSVGGWVPVGDDFDDGVFRMWRDTTKPGDLFGQFEYLKVPLGEVVCTAVVAEALPIVDDYDDVASAYEGPAAIEAVPDGALIRYPSWAGALDDEDDPHGDPDNRCIDISDQLPYGDWRPGRWAWRLTDVAQVEPGHEPAVIRGNRQGVCEIEVTW